MFPCWLGSRATVQAAGRALGQVGFVRDRIPFFFGISNMTLQKLNGHAAFLKLLEDEGVTHIFGNPGTTELALMEAMPEAKGIQYVLGLQESVVLAMADGFARASGRLTACNLHCTPGLGHAMGALYNAKFSGSPLIVTAGQYEIGYGLLEPMLYEPLVPIAQPLVKWAYEVQRVEDLPRIVRRAAKIALTPPFGPVFLSLPGSILDDEAELALGHATRVHGRGVPDEGAQHEIVEALLASKSPVIVAGRELDEQGAMADAVHFSELLGAPVYHEPIPYNTRFPTAAPTFMGDLSRNQRRVHELLCKHDLLIVLGADLLRMSAYSDVDPMPDGLKVLHVSEREWELGKNYPTDIAVRAGVGETLRALSPKLQARQAPQQAAAALDRLTSVKRNNWQKQREALVSSLRGAPAASLLPPQQLALCVADAAQAHKAVVIEEAPTTAPLLASLLVTDRPRSFFGLASGGLGFGMGGAVGAALAQPESPIIAMIGDGSAMYAIQALWTAAHLELPITYVIVNNKSYRIIKERMVAMRQCDQFLGMDLTNPALDFVAMGHGMGVPSERVDSVQELRAALGRAVQSRRPALIEVLVDAGVQRVGP
jgi:benzoylformate decarboxylase